MKDTTAQQRQPNPAERTIFKFLYCRVAKALLAGRSGKKIETHSAEENHNTTRIKHGHAESLSEKEKPTKGENKTTTIDTKMCKGQKQSSLQATPKEVFCKARRWY